MRKLTKRETTLLIVFLLMIAIVVVEYWLVPALKSWQELKARRLQLTQQWEDIAFYLGREDEMKERIGTLQAERDKLQRKLPAHQYSYLYWETILETAKESGVTISQIQEGNVDSHEETLHTYVTVKGDKNQVLEFINRLYSIPYVIATQDGTFLYEDNMITASLHLLFSGWSDS